MRAEPAAEERTQAGGVRAHRKASRRPAARAPCAPSGTVVDSGSPACAGHAPPNAVRPSTGTPPPHFAARARRVALATFAPRASHARHSIHQSARHWRSRAHGSARRRSCRVRQPVAQASYLPTEAGIRLCFGAPSTARSAAASRTRTRAAVAASPSQARRKTRRSWAARSRCPAWRRRPGRWRRGAYWRAADHLGGARPGPSGRRPRHEAAG